MVLTLTACGAGRSVATETESPAASHLLFFSSDRGVTVFDAAAGRATVSVDGGLLAPDRSTIFSSTTDAHSTVVRAFDPASGSARTAATTSGVSQLRVANHNGTVVALGPPRTEPAVGYPSGRTTTDLTIAPTDGSPARTVAVAGNVEPEAFSADDSTLFVLQYVPPEAPVGYQVRGVDLSTGAVHNIRTDDSDLDKPMAGRARTSVLAPDGTRLYTLYVVAGDSSGNAGYAFVHVLDLVSKTAFCIDLPAPFGSDEPPSYAIAASPEGTHVYVADGLHGAIADLDTSTLTVGRIGHFNAVPGSPVSAAVGADGQVFIGTGPVLSALRADSLDVDRRWSLNNPIAAVLTTPLDTNVYVATSDAVVTFDGIDIGAGPRTLTSGPGAPGLSVAKTTPSVDTRGPTQCAC
jgi:hypothetical protein